MKQEESLERIVELLFPLDELQLNKREFHQRRGVNSAYQVESYDTIDKQMNKNVAIVTDKVGRKYGLIVVGKHYQTKEGYENKKLMKEEKELRTAQLIQNYAEKSKKEGYQVIIIPVIGKDNKIQSIVDSNAYRSSIYLQGEIRKNPGRWQYLNDVLLEGIVKIGNEEMLQVMNQKGEVEHYQIRPFIDREGDEWGNIKELTIAQLASEPNSSYYYPIKEKKGQLLVDFNDNKKNGLIVPLYEKWGEELITKIGPFFNVERETTN